MSLYIIWPSPDDKDGTYLVRRACGLPGIGGLCLARRGGHGIEDTSQDVV